MDTLFENIAKGNENVSKIREQLFEVRSIPLHTNIDRFDSPDAYGIYRADGGKPFGVLGSTFQPQQPTALFDSFVRSLAENTNVDLAKLRYVEHKDGARIRFTVPIKKMGFTNLQGKEDETIISLNIQTGFDGFTATSLFLDVYRLVCSNGMKANITEFKSKFRNTIGNVGKIQLLTNDVTKALDKATDLTELIDRLNRVKIDTKRKNEFIEKVLGYSLKDKEQLTTRKQNILTKIEESMALEISRSGGNLWGLINGITYYTNHEAKDFVTLGDDARQDFIFTQTGESLNNKAIKVALEMAN